MIFYPVDSASPVDTAHNYSPFRERLHSIVDGFIPLYIGIKVLNIQENLTSPISSHDWDLSRPYELPHAPVGTPQVFSGFLEGIKALAQGIVDPLLLL